MAGDAKQAGSGLKRRSPGEVRVVRASNVNTLDRDHEMNTNTVVDMRQFVQAKNGQPFTTSQRVAEAFGKQHYHVLAKVRELDCSDHFLTHNFSWVQFEHRGNTYEACEMTKDGFMFLVMGFTGKKAAAIKEGYIAAFNWMAEQLGISSADLVGAVIGTSGVNVLDRVIDQKAGVIPKSLQRSFKHTMKSRLRSRFNVQRTDLIPADELADACNFIAAYSLEGEFIGKQQGIQIDAAPGQRYLVSYDRNGEQRITPVHRDACVMTHQQLIKAMLIPGDLPVSTDDMFEFVQAALVNLKMRSDFQAQELKRGRAAA